MKYPCLVRAAAFAAAMGVGAAFAQAPAVITDVGPSPAEDRSSVGAVVLETSPVPAQRPLIAQRVASQAEVGRGILRATARAKAEADLARAREEEGSDTRRMGAPPALKK